MTKIEELEKRIDTLEKIILPDDETKISTRKNLQKTTMVDIQPWITKKKKEGKIFTINIEGELSDCRDYFVGKKRTITTAYNWINTAQKRENERNPQKEKAGADCSWEEGFGL